MAKKHVNENLKNTEAMTKIKLDEVYTLKSFNVILADALGNITQGTYPYINKILILLDKDKNEKRIQLNGAFNIRADKDVLPLFLNADLIIPIENITVEFKYDEENRQIIADFKARNSRKNKIKSIGDLIEFGIKAMQYEEENNEIELKSEHECNKNI